MIGDRNYTVNVKIAQMNYFIPLRIVMLTQHWPSLFRFLLELALLELNPFSLGLFLLTIFGFDCCPRSAELKKSLLKEL